VFVGGEGGLGQGHMALICRRYRCGVMLGAGCTQAELYKTSASPYLGEASHKVSDACKQLLQLLCL